MNLKIFITAFFIATSVCFSQEEQKNPNVELPDFVITGQDVISIIRVEKMKPDFVSTISQEFLKPVLKPEELRIADLSIPIVGDLNLLDSVYYYKGFLSLNVGRYSVPSGELNYTFPFTRGSIHGIVAGDNQIKYDDNTDRQTYSGKLNFNYSLASDNEFLPGTKFTLGGRHKISSYKFYGSVDPGRKRTLNNGTAFFNFQNLYMKRFIFDISVSGDFTDLDEETFSESLLKAKGFGKLQLGDIKIGLRSNYQKQYLKTDSLGSVDFDFYFIRPSVSLKLFNIMMADLGFTFSGSGSDEFNKPFASLGIELSKNLVLLAEYSPVAEFLTSGQFLRENEFFVQQVYTNSFYLKKDHTEIVVKYEYDKYFQVDGGLRYFRTDNLPYYVNPGQEGFYRIAETDAKNFTGFVNLLFHLGPYGIFYGSLDISSTENSKNQQIPFYPTSIASLTYGYDFKNGLTAEATAKYLSKRYSDIENTSELDWLLDLGLEFQYKYDKQILFSLGITNILNRKIFIWDGYREKPLEVFFGVDFLFN